jgi:hypothetical protein
MDSENNFPAEFLSDAHIQFMVEYVQQSQQSEQAAIDAFLKG